jgi:hypothetical protein
VCPQWINRAARDDSLWKKANDTTLSKGGGLTLDVLKVELAKRWRRSPRQPHGDHSR